MIAYSKKEYESIDPVELPAEITDAQVTSGVGTDEVLITPTKLKTAITTHAPTGGDTLPAPSQVLVVLPILTLTF
jgi:hypothetical protein